MMIVTEFLIQWNNTNLQAKKCFFIFVFIKNFKGLPYYIRMLEKKIEISLNVLQRMLTSKGNYNNKKGNRLLRFAYFAQSVQ